jgi:hypothetical protein
MTAYLPKGFVSVLRARKVPAVTKKTKPFIKARETEKRYGWLPSEVKELLKVGDKWLVEKAKWKNARYLRAEPDGWEIPTATKGEPLLGTFMRRFDWNVFSNMQLWEHFAGVMTIAVHESSGRFLAARVERGDGTSPVFYMDHETARIEGCVSDSVRHFVMIEMDNDVNIPEEIRKLVLKPESWDRAEDEGYLPRDLRLRNWPPFLAARADWIVAALAFGAKEAAHHLAAPEVRCFDAKIELPLVASSEALALYWLMRSFLLSERDVFDETAKRASENAPPLVASCIDVVRERWADPKPESVLVKARDGLARLDTPKKPAWRAGFDRSEL